MTRPASFRRVVLVATAMVALAQCDWEGTRTLQNLPADIAPVSGHGQTGTVAQALALPLVVRVTNSKGVGVEGVAVSWAVLGGGGSLSAATPTDTTGETSVIWTLGTVAGTHNQAVAAAVNGLSGPPVTFIASADPGPPSQLRVISGNGQTGAVGRALPQPLVVAVHDQYQNGVPDVAVTWAVAAGGGSVSSTSVATDADGKASATWILGTVAGLNTAGAVASGLDGSPATFSATANPGPPSRLVEVSGNGQTGALGQALPQPLVVAVHDQYANLLRDVTVTWAVTSGGGSVSSSSVTTGADGQASAAWTLGTVAGANSHTATATVTGLTGSPVTFAASANPGPPSRLVEISGNGQNGGVGRRLGQPLLVAVQDQIGKALSNVAVIWTVTSGGGSVSSNSVPTDAAGRASVTWTLGTVAGAGN